MVGRSTIVIARTSQCVLPPRKSQVAERGNRLTCPLTTEALRLAPCRHTVRRCRRRLPSIEESLVVRHRGLTFFDTPGDSNRSVDYPEAESRDACTSILGRPPHRLPAK